MRNPLSSSRKCPICGILFVVVAFLLAASSSRADPPAGSNALDSVSVGLPMNGSLQRGEVLPRKGTGYVLIKSARERKARFGVLELVMLIKDAAYKVSRKHKGSILRVADLSTRKGGKIDHHGSHQNGRDVDFAFFMVDKQGAQAVSDVFVPFDANGYSVDPPMEYRFDTRRNWALAEALIKSRRATVQWIFVADHLKKLLIKYGETHGAKKSVLRMAEQIIHQPSKKAHWDHFHVRIYCPSDDSPECRDVGPRWAWVK